MQKADLGPTRTLTLTIPTAMAEELHQLAFHLHLDLQSLALQAVEHYVHGWQQANGELNDPIDPVNPESMTLAEVAHLVKQSRSSESKAA